jgi:hypothetical protein
MSVPEYVWISTSEKRIALDWMRGSLDDLSDTIAFETVVQETQIYLSVLVHKEKERVG